MKRNLVRLACLAIVAAALVGGAMRLFRIHSLDDLRVYYLLSRNFHPVWRPLWHGRFSAGDPTGDFVAAYPPTYQLKFAPFTVLYYTPPGSFDSLAVWVKDGRLAGAAAGSCSWRRVFFEAPGFKEANAAAFRAYVERCRRENDLIRIRTAFQSGVGVFLAEGEDFESASRGRSDTRRLRVREVFHGEIEPDAVLDVSTEDIDWQHAEDDTIGILHFLDQRALYPHASPEAIYSSVPPSALATYRSMTEAELLALEKRVAERQEEWRRIRGGGG